MKTSYLLKAVAVLLLATPAFGGFTFTNSELLSLTDLATTNVNAFNDPLVFSTSDHTFSGGVFTAYGATKSFLGSVGYSGDLEKDKNVYIGTTDGSITASAKTEGTYFLTLHNDNEEDWNVWLKAVGMSGTVTSSTELLSGDPTFETVSLSLDVSGIGTITSIGFVIEHAGVVSGTDRYHISATVPAPGALILGSIGVILVGYLRRRRAM